MLHILHTNGNNVDELAKTLDKESGLKGISGTASDMRKLHEAAGGGNTRAELAIEMFTRAAAKAIGGFATTMGKLDALLSLLAESANTTPTFEPRICAGMAILACG